jgi:DNA-binding MarR family transcriptional regulator
VTAHHTDSSDKTALKSWLALLQSADAIKKAIDSKFRSEFGISISRFDILSALERAGRNGLRSGELSRQLFVSDGNTTQIMSKLVTQKLVLKRTDERDARATLYSLSDEGKALFDKMAHQHLSWIREIFAGHDVEELQVFLSTLDRLPPSVPFSLKAVA